MPSGKLAMYFILARMVTYGFAIAMLCFARRPTPLTGGFALFDLMLLGDRLLAGVLAGESAVFLPAGLLAFRFYRGWSAPRTLALTGVVLATISLNSAADYRTIVREEKSLDWMQISNIDVVGNFLTVLEEGGPETRNAVERMAIVERNQS